MGGKVFACCVPHMKHSNKTHKKPGSVPSVTCYTNRETISTKLLVFIKLGDLTKKRGKVEVLSVGWNYQHLFHTQY